MFKRCLAILLFLIICICAVSAVSANDLNETFDGIGQENSVEMTISDEEDVSASSGVKSYSDLSDLIDSRISYGEVTLKNDYMYDYDYDWELGYDTGILIEDDMVINGNGHTIYCNDACPFFIYDNAHVSIRDLTFIGDYKNGYEPPSTEGGAIANYGTVYLINCNFYNCQARNEGGAIYNKAMMVVESCVFLNNHLYNKTGLGGAISNDGILLINDSYFTNNTAYKGGAINTAKYTFVRQSIFGTITGKQLGLDENVLVGSDKASYGVSIYNKPGSACDAHQCYFNETSKVEVLSDVISSSCIFEKANNVRGGLLYNFTAGDDMSHPNTVFSNGLTFKTNPSINTFYKSGDNLEVTVTDSATGKGIAGVGVGIIVDGNAADPKIIVTDSNGVAKFAASSLTPAEHKLDVGLGNEVLCPTSVSVPVTVKKSKVTISVSKITTTYNSGKKWTIKATDSSNGKPAANIKIKLKVYTGSSYKTYTVKTNSKGVAYFTASKMKKGYHKVVLSVSQTGYYGNSKTSSIKINPAGLKYNVYRITKGYAGGVTVYVKLASTNEYKNGIKLNLKVYTGSKYKTFTLVTGYDDDEMQNGCIGIFTNKFSVGTHKVVISPANNNYKGTKTTSIVIKSSTKNYQKTTMVFTNGKTVYK